MRVNSYNKFFTEVAKIMNTEVKSVKPIDGRYKVELANHVCLNVYRGVSGSLFMHDRRGVAHITSCYDFDDFKTMKDLYERLISDYSESTNAETVTQTSEETNKTENCESTNNDIKGHIYIDTDSVKVAPLPEQQTSEESIKDTVIADDTIAYQNARVKETKPTVLNVMQCMMCPADREGNRCGGKQWCKQTWKRYDAIVNPEWHHINLNTLANLDFDMLDEKRHLYLKLYRELKELIQDLHKCKSGRTYERRLAKMYIRNAELVDENKISNDYINYVTRKISMCNVECGLWTSRVEAATGLHKSRRYNRHILKY